MCITIEPVSAKISHSKTPILGDDVSLECQVNGADEVSEITWTKKGQKLSQGSKYSINKASLKIVKTNEDDSGAYECEVKSNKGVARASMDLKLGKITKITFIRINILVFFLNLRN